MTLVVGPGARRKEGFVVETGGRIAVFSLVRLEIRAFGCLGGAKNDLPGIDGGDDARLKRTSLFLCCPDFFSGEVFLDDS
jgi:hypothetical protein